MTSANLRPEQAHKLMASVGRQVQYLNRLCARMDRLRFPPDDPLWRAAIKARDAARELYVASHYAECKTGVGRAEVVDGA